jgi:ATP-dependent protease HslVU (ClpYQ) peptidase subunit
MAHFENGFIVGFVGSFAKTRLWFSNPEWFFLPRNLPLTQNYIIQNMVNPWFQMLQEENNDSGVIFDSGCDVMVIRDDQLFLVNGFGEVYEMDEYLILGSGTDAAYPAILEPKDIHPEVRIKKALKASMRYDNGVSNPALLINTKTYELKKEIL